MQLDDGFSSKHKISDDIYFAVLLHDHPELINECCDLINLEWKRSHEARLRSINGSSSNFPTSVLLLRESRKPKVIGHCKLSKISGFNPLIFVQTVVIHPKYRGKGLGKLLMEKAEIYVKRCNKGIQCLYLTTMGKERFYEKLGYSYCQPISIYGGGLNFISADHEISQEELFTGKQAEKEKPAHEKGTSFEIMDAPSPPPPPPPPPPPLSSFCTNTVHITNKKVYMRKKL